jgi:hypothetical protein
LAALARQTMDLLGSGIHIAVELGEGKRPYGPRRGVWLL